LREPEDIAKRWEECLASLFHNDREEDDDKTVSYESGPLILKEEAQWALQHCKTGKAADQDEVVVEMLIDSREDGLDVLWGLLKNIHTQINGSKSGQKNEHCPLYFFNAILVRLPNPRFLENLAIPSVQSFFAVSIPPRCAI